MQTNSKHSADRKINLWLLAWPLGAILYVTARFIPGAAEYFYARGVYRVYSFIMSLLTGWIPLSIAEILVFGVPVLIIVIFAAGIAKSIRRRTIMELLKSVRLIAIIAGVIFAWYMIGCGTNYYRYEFSHFSGLQVRDSSAEELYELCTELAVKTNEAREEAVKKAVESGSMTDGSEVYSSYMTLREKGLAAKRAMTALAEKYPVLQGYFPRPKAVLLSRGMSELNITGVYFPWTVEANVNVDIPDYPIGVTMCHELSHLRGFMREDEANFIGYLGCVNSEEPDLVYSGYMLALSYAAGRLYSEDKDLYFKVRELYSDGIVTDMIANNEYWKPFEDTVASRVGETVNNTYLKANNQTDGTKSYGRMVDLLLAEMRAKKNAS